MIAAAAVSSLSLASNPQQPVDQIVSESGPSCLVIPAKAGVFNRVSDIQEESWVGKTSGSRIRSGMTAKKTLSTAIQATAMIEVNS